MSRHLLRACWGTALLVQVVVAQTCYYPNGKEAPEKPCSSAEGSACCPDKWECLDNGLCHYEPDNLFGRYSCTDQSWEAPGCPSNLCTYNMGAIGGESITQCSNHDNQWCCNADATHVNCCQESPEPRPFFNLQDGKAYATVGSSTASDAPNLASITGSATSGSDSSSSTEPPSSSPQSQSAGSPSSSPVASKDEATTTPSPTTPTAPTTPITSLQTSLSSGTNGIQTIIITSIITPAAAASTSTSTPPPSSSKKSNLPIIVGCAVGIPLFLTLVAILIWLLHKRKQQRHAKTPYPEHHHAETSPSMSHATGSTNGFIGGAAAKLGYGKKRDSAMATTYKHETENGGLGVAELPGTGAELDSGAGFAAGRIPYGPNAVGLGGGSGTGNGIGQGIGHGHGHVAQSSWGSAPPRYSPGVNQQAWSQEQQQQQQQQQPAELGNTTASQTPAGGYIPYRPQGSQQHLSGVPEAAELSTVTTPPAAELSTVTTPPAVELGTVKTPPA
ncbi:hypothetical protein P154DRAFT_550835 [Amniculicola lignicola CBS 123094]|uniref:Mid2 domain-containing protein n=1 Tax=Amniculicola lignicola CBS 123094 TaxID=1392246 RepID=A0A6A5X1A8_9PLEO|nr:hypothetical protein P154DRAFT_550835 [Amniculicola lignicola CBS 123094]